MASTLSSRHTAITQVLSNTVTKYTHWNPVLVSTSADILNVRLAQRKATTVRNVRIVKGVIEPTIHKTEV